MPYVTDKVREIVGTYPHPGKFEGGTNLDPIIFYTFDTSDYVSLNDEGAWACAIVMPKEETFVHYANDSNLYPYVSLIDASKVRDIVRSILVSEDSQGFAYVSYFDRESDAHTELDKLMDSYGLER